MSADAKTKRRKVWVNDRDGVLGGTCEKARSNAEMLSGKPVKFIEARPGDVVLSREDVAELKTLVGSIEWAPHAQRALALLRGGR